MWTGQCVKDKPSRRLLPVNFGQSSENSPEYCVKKCKSQEYSYAGLESGRRCFCSNTPPPKDALVNANSSCTTTCPGESSSMCGGANMVNVYETGDEGGGNSFPLTIYFHLFPAAPCFAPGVW